MMHRAIAKKIAEDLKDHEVYGPEISSWDEDKMIRRVFYNLRGPPESLLGLQLSALGFGMLSEMFSFYEIEMENALGTTGILYLDKRAKYPYFVEGSMIYTADPDLFIELTMLSGDTEQASRMFGWQNEK